ncbi:MAG: sodium/proline symporter [Saccharofermentanales bacterium]
MSSSMQILIVMILYITVVIGIGIYYAKRANESSENFLLGGRQLGPWITAMGAEASDMSGWLLMGLPGVAYYVGLSDAIWTAIGLLIGTYLNWLLVAKRIRSYSVVAGDAITIPDFLSNRYKENKKIILMIAAVFILIFFTVYAASCFVTVGKLFSTLFNTQYHTMMIAGAIFVVAYTFIGGFLAESASDFMQGVIMFFALMAALIVGVLKAGGVGAIIENARQIPGFLEFFGMAQPVLVDGVQVVEAGKPVFGTAVPYGFLTIISTLSWGLGYFGMPQILLKFMAIRKIEQLTLSRRIAVIWCAISLAIAVSIGIIGRVLFPTALLTQSDAESIFILISSSYFVPVFAGLVMAGILAATISSSDSYLLIAASSLSKNIYQGIIKKNASDRAVLVATRVTLIIIALIAMVIALDENNRIIFSVVSFAWAGFGATFGPIILFSLFWKRTTRAGAIAGMVSGGAMVFFWKLLLKPQGGVFGIYELLPAFVVSCLAILLVSLLTPEPDISIKEEFEAARQMSGAN